MAVIFEYYAKISWMVDNLWECRCLQLVIFVVGQPTSMVGILRDRVCAGLHFRFILIEHIKQKGLRLRVSSLFCGWKDRILKLWVRILAGIAIEAVRIAIEAVSHVLSIAPSILSKFVAMTKILEIVPVKIIQFGFVNTPVPTTHQTLVGKSLWYHTIPVLCDTVLYST